MIYYRAEVFSTCHTSGEGGEAEPRSFAAEMLASDLEHSILDRFDLIAKEQGGGGGHGLELEGKALVMDVNRVIRTGRIMPVLTAWLRASWERVDCSWHHH